MEMISQFGVKQVQSSSDSPPQCSPESKITPTFVKGCSNKDILINANVVQSGVTLIKRLIINPPIFPKSSIKTITYFFLAVFIKNKFHFEEATPKLRITRFMSNTGNTFAFDIFI